MERLSDKARMYARSYGQPPYGREVDGTAELLLQMADKLEEYEDLEEQGKLPKPPVPVGTLVYEPYRFLGEGAWEIDVHKIRLEDLDKIGKTVFLTQEEAEAALKELEDKAIEEMQDLLWDCYTDSGVGADRKTGFEAYEQEMERILNQK